MIGIVWLNKPLICIKNRVGGKMKILLVNKFHYNKGGAETYYFTLADALKRMGHEVLFFSMKHPNNNYCEQEKYFVTNREYNKKTSLIKKISAAKSLIYSKEAYKKISLLLDKEKPDLVILNNIHRQITTSIIDAIYERKIKIFWVVHDLIMLCPNYTMLDNSKKICESCSKGNYRYCLKKKCVKNSFIKSFFAMKEAEYIRKKQIYKKIDLFITPSNFYRDKLIEYGFNKNKILHIPNPLSFETKFEVNNDHDNYLLYFGRLSKEKGISTLIKAMKRIDYKLIILGTGPIEKELKNLVVKEGLNEKVSLLGFKQGEELKNYIRKSKAVILPSEWYENGPYSAMEAMALGKPLIVSNYGGLPELVENGKNGFIFKNINELVNSINKIINLDSNSYDLMCKESIKRAKENFDIENYVLNMTDKYIKGRLKN